MALGFIVPVRDNGSTQRLNGSTEAEQPIPVGVRIARLQQPLIRSHAILISHGRPGVPAEVAGPFTVERTVSRRADCYPTFEPAIDRSRSLRIRDSSVICLASANTSFRICRRDFGPLCLARPLAAALALPAIVLGPVECSHGRFCRAASCNRCRPSAVSGPRFRRFRLPALTRFAFFPDISCLDYLPLRWSPSFRARPHFVLGLSQLDSIDGSAPILC